MDTTTTTTTRTRGKRRKGRKSTNQLIEEKEKQQQVEEAAVEPPHLVEAEPELENKAINDTDTTTSTNNKTDNNNSNQTKDKNKKRYCIGRKPVTDFMVGHSYEAKVVYAKPFGVFLDIGCHSDAFCHVSRCSDDYIDAHQMQAIFQPGQVLPQKARVVEIQKKQKRITVSLQSEARREDELQSSQARQARNEKRKKVDPKDSHKDKHDMPVPKKSKTVATKTTRENQHHHQPASSPLKAEIPVIKKDLDAQKAPHETVGRAAFHKTATPVEKPESEMTHAELKRARKIARRAARRVQQEGEAAA